MGLRHRFAPIRRRRAASAPPTERHGGAAVEEPPLHDSPAAPWISMGTAGLEFFAKLLWLPEYTLLFLREVVENLRARGESSSNLAPSTYRARLHGEAAERYDFRRFQQKRDQLAIELHANNHVAMMSRLVRPPAVPPFSPLSL